VSDLAGLIARERSLNGQSGPLVAVAHSGCFEWNNRRIRIDREDRRRTSISRALIILTDQSDIEVYGGLGRLLRSSRFAHLEAK